MGTESGDRLHLIVIRYFRSCGHKQDRMGSFEANSVVTNSLNVNETSVKQAGYDGRRQGSFPTKQGCEKCFNGRVDGKLDFL